METNEKVLFSNSFGTVSDKRVILNYKKGGEDLPVGQITSVSYQHRRNHIFTIGSFLMAIGGLVLLFLSLNNLTGAKALILLFFIAVALLSGIANWIGHHVIIISAGGKDRKPLKAEMSKTKEGREFVEAVKRTIIR